MSAEERRLSILEAGARYIETNGITNLHVRTVARELDITPQWFYHFFDDIDGLILAIWEWQISSIVAAPAPTPQPGDNVRELLKLTAPRWVKIPLASAIIALKATAQFTENPDSPRWVVFHRKRLEQNWINPMLASGMPTDFVYATTLSLNCAILATVIAHQRGYTSEYRALEIIIKYLDAVVDPTWVLPGSPEESVQSAV